MKFSAREDIIQITPLWKGERFEDGRPKVPDDILRRMRNITLEEAWGPLWRKGYKYQFEGEFRTTHPGNKLIGRAVTTSMVPMRPDLHQTLLDYGHKEEGRKGFFNQWVIDSLVEDDVVVVDLFDKIFQGTYVGGNLSTAIAHPHQEGRRRDLGRHPRQRAGCADPRHPGLLSRRGSHRYRRCNHDLLQRPHPHRQGHLSARRRCARHHFRRHLHPLPPRRKRLLVHAEKSHVRDIFGFQRLEEKIYTTAQIDGRWTLEMFDDSSTGSRPMRRPRPTPTWIGPRDLEELKKWIAGASPGCAAVTL